MIGELEALLPGPVMLDVSGLELTAEEREVLQHPLVGGVILFSRNYQDPLQLSLLTDAIRSTRRQSLLIAVDHEGGRVQRFRQGFSRIPAMRTLGALWDAAQHDACARARDIGWLLGAELRSHGVDLSFTPVLDLDYGVSSVIGDRAFHRDPKAVTALALALIEGLREVGMGAVGKHFPGHGAVQADSHVAIPVDSRRFEAIWTEDMQPYRSAALLGVLSGVMPAHVTYPAADDKPSGFSPFWLQTVLRRHLGFGGVIFSDDLSMEGASVAGDVVDRASAALSAGCDMVLVCNAPEAARVLLSRWKPAVCPKASTRIAALLPQPSSIDPFRLSAVRKRIADAEMA